MSAEPRSHCNGEYTEASSSRAFYSYLTTVRHHFSTEEVTPGLMPHSSGERPKCLPEARSKAKPCRLLGFLLEQALFNKDMATAQTCLVRARALAAQKRYDAEREAARTRPAILDDYIDAHLESGVRIDHLGKLYLGLSASLLGSALDPAMQERIALAVAEANGCGYCLSAHTYLARNVAKLDDAEITASRHGASNDLRADAAVRFAATVVQARGHVSDTALAAVKAAGWSDAAIVEIVLAVALNTFTNYLNEVAQTPLDFPVVSVRRAA